ncbi:MAG: PspA/IM30 family protein, partial [Cyanobacteria bacterium J055]
IPLIAGGALTGAALYEALRSIVEGDASSVSAAAVGAATGAATSAAIGGVGVTMSGSAFGVGMLSMAAGGAVVGLGVVGLHRLLQQGIDLEKLLDRAIDQMETEYQQARQAAINALTSQKLQQRHYDRVQAEVQKWERRAKLALQKGNEFLAREALIRKKMHSEILSKLPVPIDRGLASVENLKQDLSLFKAKIAEAKTMRTRLKVKMAAAKARQLQNTIARVDTNSSMAAFDRMEEKVLQMEARSQAVTDISGADLDSLFASLETSDPDDELESLKAQLRGA